MTKGNLDELDIAWAELAASAHSKLRTVVYQLDVIVVLLALILWRVW